MCKMDSWGRRCTATKAMPFWRGHVTDLNFCMMESIQTSFKKYYIAVKIFFYHKSNVSFKCNVYRVLLYCDVTHKKIEVLIYLGHLFAGCFFSTSKSSEKVPSALLLFCHLNWCHFRPRHHLIFVFFLHYSDTLQVSAGTRPWFHLFSLISKGLFMEKNE